MESPTQSDELLVLAADDAFVAAEVARDEQTLRLIVDDRFQFNSHKGTTTDKEHLIQSILQMGLTAQTSTERSVLIEGDVAFVFGTDVLFDSAAHNPEVASKLRYTAAYVRRQGRWRLLALQVQPRAT